MNQKSLIAILIITIIVLIGTTVYFATTKSVNQPITTTSEVVQQSAPTQISETQQPTAQPTQTDETASWQTHKNEKYGFEVKYPKGWKTGTDISGQSINFMPIGGQDVALIFFVYDKSLSETEASLPIFSVPGRKVDSRTDVTINNLNWTKLIINTNQIVLLTYNNGKTYTAQYSTFESVSPQIISTFKFTN